MLLQRVPPLPFIGTATLFFFVVNLLKAPGYVAAGTLTIDGIRSIMWVLPLVPVGVWIGRKAIERINPRVFEWLMQGLLIFMSLWLIISTATR